MNSSILLVAHLIVYLQKIKGERKRACFKRIAHEIAPYWTSVNEATMVSRIEGKFNSYVALHIFAPHELTDNTI